MQRKNSFLNPSKRKGFAMIMAIILIVVLTSIMALTLTLTSQTSKQTTDLYLREQAVLLAQSAAEYTMLAISGKDRDTSHVGGGCLGQVNAFYPSSTNPIFDINVSIKYIGLNCGGGMDYISSITTPESNGTVLLDITVVSHDTTTSTEPIRYFRRTLQKL